jgi:DHA1 family multidrug resistance protein-like MFS transporter
MLRLIRREISSIKKPAYAAFSLAFASLGDAFLYPFLPQYGGSMGIPLAWIGFLLAVNRFVRIAFNPVAPQLFAKFGIRRVTIAASLMAVVSTFGYGLNCRLAAFAVLRIIWGLSFAILRISTLAHALDHEQPGRSIGIGKSIQEIGPMAALWIGPLFLTILSPPHVFFVLAALSIPSLVFAFNLPEGERYYTPNPKFIFSVPSVVNMVTFTVSFIAEGVIVVAAGLLFRRTGKLYPASEITILVAGYLAYRRLCSVLLSPVAGTIADRLGFSVVFNGSATLIALGLILLLCGCTAAGLVVIFSFNSVNSAMAPGGVAADANDKIKALWVNATWRDTGVAAGTLTGGLLLHGTYLYETILIATFILTILLLTVYAKKRTR